MMDTGYATQADLLHRHLTSSPHFGALQHAYEGVEQQSLHMILHAAARFAQDELTPANVTGDRSGCTLRDGRVKLPSAYHSVWAQFVEGGWNAIDQPVRFGGQGLPLVVNLACRELFDRACMAFGMVPGAQRAASQVLMTYAPKSVSDEWIPQFISGKWAATIAISEADAGSDLARVRTTAVPADGMWRVTGEKMWTSFGDHDLADRIGHLLLARTPDAPLGSAGLSLFLVPNKVMRDGDWASNGVHVRRIERKLGLHGSPTCAMGFENAEAILIGELGRGLPQLFVMIQNMRVLVAAEGVGVAAGAADTALQYARQRRQGGPAIQPAVPLIEHADIQRMLMTMHSRVEVLRALNIEMAMRIDLANAYPPDDKASAALVQWLLPVLKATASEAGFDTAHEAMQILGGAGYTTEWPVEQWMRDIRMASIAEGATGIQALDLLHRRLWRDGGIGLQAFIEAVEGEACDSCNGMAGPIVAVLARLRQGADYLISVQESPWKAERGATAFLRLAGVAAMTWMAARLARKPSVQDAITQRLNALGEFYLRGADATSAYWLSQVTTPSDPSFYEAL